MMPKIDMMQGDVEAAFDNLKQSHVAESLDFHNVHPTLTAAFLREIIEQSATVVLQDVEVDGETSVNRLQAKVAAVQTGCDERALQRHQHSVPAGRVGAAAAGRRRCPTP